MTTVFGPAGYGKSQALKAVLRNQLVAARRDGSRVWFLDPMGSWGPLLRKGSRS